MRSSRIVAVSAALAVVAVASLAWAQGNEGRSPTIGGVIAERLGLPFGERSTSQQPNTGGNRSTRGDNRFPSRPLLDVITNPTPRLAQQPARQNSEPQPRRGTQQPTRAANTAQPTPARTPDQPVTSSRRRSAGSGSPATALPSPARTNLDPLPQGVDALRRGAATQRGTSAPSVAADTTSPAAPGSSVPHVADRRSTSLPTTGGSLSDRLSAARGLAADGASDGESVVEGPALSGSEVNDAATTGDGSEPTGQAWATDADESPAAAADATTAAPGETWSRPRAMPTRPLGQTPAAPTSAPTTSGVSATPRFAENPASDVPSRGNGDVLITRKSPVIAVETLGPRRVLIGRESTYKVLMRNAGNVDAAGVEVTVSVPDGADIVGFEPSIGRTQDPALAEQRGIVWSLDHLAAGENAELQLRIVPRQSRPFDLGVQWTYSSQASQAIVEVQEPKLAMSLTGPREVYYGRPAVFELKLSNPGTGPADGVVVRLLPTVEGPIDAPAQTIGTLLPGESKSIEVEVTARQSGQLAIRAEASAEGGLKTSVGEEVLVRKAELQLDVTGSRFQYAGTTSTYTVRVSNPGNAVARDVRLIAPLPPGVKYVSSTRNGQLDAQQNKVVWAIDSLPPGGEQLCELVCELTSAGLIKQQVIATGDDDLRTQQVVTTQVEAMADLALEVKDPSGPVPVGQEMVYEVRIRNRGTKAAENVDLVAFFSEGLEPVAVQGGGHHVSVGQVAFDRIASLGAGRELSFKIRAVADRDGSHVFRTEARCDSLSTLLAVEETTHFYGEPQASQTVTRPNEPARLMGEPTPATPRVAEPPQSPTRFE